MMAAGYICKAVGVYIDFAGARHLLADIHGHVSK